MPRLNPRTVVRHYYFQRKLAALACDAREANEFADAAEYFLARDPTLGVPINDKIWFLSMAGVPSKQIGIYYEFDDKTVRLRSIKAF